MSEQEFKNKNDYSCIFFFSFREPVKYQYVHGCYGLSQYVKNKIGDYDYVNIYVRRSGRLIGQFKKTDYLPNKPK